MFYSEFVLAKKGPLGKVWLAAHWSKKLTRQQISHSDVVDICNSIIKPAAPLALRTSGHLLLGVVRIHDFKQRGLMADCNDAFVKIRLAFRPGVVELAPGATQAPAAAITLTENFADFDGAVLQTVDLEQLAATNTMMNIGRLEDITMTDAHFAADFGVEAPRVNMGDFGDHTGADVAPFAMSFAEDVEQLRAGAGPGGDLERSYEPVDATMDQSYDSRAAPRHNQPDFQTDFPAELAADFPTEYPDMDQRPPFAPEDLVPLDASELPPPALTALSPATATRPVEPAQSGEARLDDVLAPTPARKPLARKRKVKIDEVTILSGDSIRAGLAPSGPDDISRAPYSAEPLLQLNIDFGPPTKKLFRRGLRLGDDSVDAALKMPNHTNWGKKLTQKFLSAKPAVEAPKATARATPTAKAAAKEAAAAKKAAAAAAAAAADEVDQRFDRQDLPDQFMPPELDYPDMRDDGGRWGDERMDHAADQPRLPDFYEGADTTFGGGDATLNDTTDPAQRTPARAANRAFLESLDESQAQPDGGRHVSAKEFAQLGWSKRTRHMLASLKTTFTEDATPRLFSSFTQNGSRRVAAGAFFEMLVLKTQDFIHVQQPEPLGDFTVLPTPKLFADIAPLPTATAS